MMKIFSLKTSASQTYAEIIYLDRNQMRPQTNVLGTDAWVRRNLRNYFCLLPTRNTEKE